MLEHNLAQQLEWLQSNLDTAYYNGLPNARKYLSETPLPNRQKKVYNFDTKKRLKGRHCALSTLSQSGLFELETFRIAKSNTSNNHGGVANRGTTLEPYNHKNQFKSSDNHGNGNLSSISTYRNGNDKVPFKLTSVEHSNRDVGIGYKGMFKTSSNH